MFRSHSTPESRRALARIQGYLPYIAIVFLNAFVDLGHKIVIQNTLFKVYDGATQIVLSAIINGLILLPFILLFSPAGFLSDRYPKPRVMRLSAWAAVAITLLITGCYYLGWFWAAFGLTFILAIQSALYSPAKYGYIKELVGDAKLTRANAGVQAVTICGILLGTFFFSGVFEYLLEGQVWLTTDSPSQQIITHIAPLGWLLVGFSLIEALLCYRLPNTTYEAPTPTNQTDSVEGDDATSKHQTTNKVSATAPPASFSLQRYWRLDYLRQNITRLRQHRAIWLSIIGISTFMAVSQVVMASFPAFAKVALNTSNTLHIQGILACSGIGIVLGALFAGRLSRRHIETGLIPIGALAVTVALLLIPNLNSVATLAAAFVLLGVGGGFFMIPLHALIQYHAQSDELGTVLAGNNWVQNITMLSFLLLTVGFALSGGSAKTLLYMMVVVAVIGSVYCIKKLPQSLARLLVSVLFKRRYNIEVMGFNHLPSEGPVLLLGNHISWIDWALIQIACPRPVRFVMQREIYNRWYLKPLMQALGMIPIASGSSKQALKDINKVLNNGEVVCLFPEGAISHNGHLGQFLSGYERAVQDLEQGVIVPFYLRGLWGSQFSRSSDKLRETSSIGLQRDLIVAFGPPLPLSTPARELKQKVFELSCEAWEQFTQTLDPIPLTWIRTAKRESLSPFVTDSEGDPLTYRRTLAASLAFARSIKKRSPEERIGLVLPASSASMITNMAVLINGQTAVNLNYTSSIEAVKSAISNADIRTVYSSRRFVKKLTQRGINIDDMLQNVNIIYLEDVKASLPKHRLIMALAASYLPARWVYNLYGKQRQLEDPAAILFSSGSEGTPKGVVLSHRNILANSKQISDLLNISNNDVIVGCLPPFHSFGLTVTTLMPMLQGLPTVCHPDPTDVVNVAKAIARQRATILIGTATFLRLYAKNSRVSPLMLNSLRVVISGAEKLPASIRAAFESKFKKGILEGYGATETTPVVSCNIPDCLDTNYWKVQRGNQEGTVGMPLPGSCVRIVDPDTLQTLPQGDDGLILVTGTQVMLGYLNDAEKTQNVIVELDGKRWYKTGDKGHLTEDGFITIVDRYSRFAKVGGEMISLGAVEQEVRRIFSNDDGDMPFDIGAINVPDDKKGEKVLLLIAYDDELTPTDTTWDESGIRQELMQAGMDTLMLPASCYIVDDIPKLGSGKTDYKSLSELARRLVG